MQQVRFRSRVPVPVADLFAWHAREGAFERLVPPWQQVRIVQRDGSIRDGDVLRMRIHLGPFFKDWVALHSDFVQDVQFRDTQMKGLFSVWVHTHRTHPVSQSESILDDSIVYKLPVAAVLQPLAGRIARAELGRMFRYRHLRTRLDVTRHYHYRSYPRVSASIVGEHPFAAQLGAFFTGGGHTIHAANTSAVEIDLGGLSESGNRYVLLKDSATLETRHVAMPDTIIGQSFGPTGVASFLGNLRRTSDDWIAEDDLISLIYHLVLTADSSNNANYRCFSDFRAAQLFLKGRL